MTEKTLIQKIYNVQTKIGAIKKGSVNPFYNSKFFDINGLLKALKPLLEEEKLVVLQPLTSHEGKAALSLTVYDVDSKDKLFGDPVILPENSDPQKMGSIFSYYRRYALQSFFLLEAEDDDGNSAIPTKTAKAPVAQSNEPTKEAYSNDPEAAAEIVREDKLKPCHKCNGTFSLRSGPYGEFFGCSGYPECKNKLTLDEAQQWLTN